MRKILIPKRLLVALLPIVGVLSLAAPAAAAGSYGPGSSGWDNYYANPTNTSTWSGFCGGAGASKVTSAAVAAPACGPTGDDSISIPDTYPYQDGGETTTPGFQCVELTDRYLYVIKHWGALVGDGADVARVYGAKHGVTPIRNGSGQAPAAGDVISFSVESNFTDDNGVYPGHTAIVSSSSVNAAGNGSITILSENWGETAAPATLGVSHWSVGSITTYDSYGAAVTTPYVEWLPLAGSSASSAFEVGAEASNNNLYLYSSTSGGDQLGLGMLPGTSPSLTALGGTYDSAFQDNGDYLYVHSPTQNSPFGLGMMPGTSPSITALTTGNYEVAFQDNDGTLYLHTPGQNTLLGLSMEHGTSPSIAPLPSGSYEVAFAANTGDLYLHHPGQNLPLDLGMMKGTSPSITELSNGSYEVAFQANTGDLWTYSPSNGATNLRLKMAAGTSPSITASGSGFEIAYQGSNNDLYTYSSATGTTTNLEQGMMAGTSPSIAAISAGTFETAFQANTGVLIMVGAKPIVTGLKMRAGTSPSIEA
jgi:hypothetical protein